MKRRAAARRKTELAEGTKEGRSKTENPGVFEQRMRRSELASGGARGDATCPAEERGAICSNDTRGAVRCGAVREKSQGSELQVARNDRSSSEGEDRRNRSTLRE